MLSIKTMDGEVVKQLVKMCLLLRVTAARPLLDVSGVEGRHNLVYADNDLFSIMTLPKLEHRPSS